MSDYLQQRGNRFYYRRRVPRELASYDPRPEIKISLKTASRAEAGRLADVYNDYIEAFWRDLVDKGKMYQDDAYHRAVALARAHGFTYKKATDVARGPLGDILARINAASASDAPLPAIAGAVLGGIDRPAVLLSTCIDRFWTLAADRIAGKSVHQIRKWKNPRRLALDNFIAVVGDKGIQDVTRTDALAFRDWWMAKIAAGTHNGDTANKQLERVRDILQTVARSEEIDLDYKQMFAELKFQPKRSQRASYDPAFVQDRILAPGALDGLNEDARLLVIAMACTGAREGELVGLRAEDIVLDVKVPYIHIRPYDGHLLKTAQSERQIPLVGPALKSFKNKPEGITRYEQADSVCAVVNKYLTRHSLRPTEKHSLYSLRHCFKDRLRDAGAPEEIIDELMGHEGHRPKYGRGHLLESKLKWMKKIAFR